MLLTVVSICAGLVLLIKGGDVLVSGASSLAFRLGITPLMIGLTVVALGTSSPEIAVTALSGSTGHPELALGNVIGSNIANLLFVLGVVTILSPLIVERELLKLHIPIMIGSAGLMLALAVDGWLSFLDGAILLGCLFLFLTMLVLKARHGKGKAMQESDVPPTGGIPLWKATVMIVCGLAMLLLGAHWVVQGASLLARMAGLSELMVGITIVAIGTSLPEVTTLVIAIRKKKAGIGIGAVVGSNIFNTFAVMGIGALSAGSTGIAVSAQALSIEIPIMLCVTVLVLPLALTHKTLERWEGAVLLGGYCCYLAYQILLNTAPQFTPGILTIWSVLLGVLGLFGGLALLSIRKEVRN
jgi:cation:H+ antiporter